MMNTLKILKEGPVEARGFLAGMVESCVVRFERFVFKYKEITGKYKEITGKYKVLTSKYKGYLFFVLLVLLWFLLPLRMGETALVTDGLWQLVLMALICFLGMLWLCWWLLGRFWVFMGLPELGAMVGFFKEMKLCYQFGFYLSCFALLLLAALGCLTAVL